MTALEDRLRSELRTEAGQVTPDSIAGLRLPPPAGRAPRRGGPRRWRAWAKPLAAAAAVAVAVAGTFAAVHTIRGAAPAASRHHARPAAGGALPAWYGYTVEGYIWHHVSGGTDSGQTADRYLRIRATATGKMLATVSPPKPYNAVQSLTADASGRVFVFGAARVWERGPNPPPGLTGRDETTPLKFMVVRVTPAGQVRVSALAVHPRPSPAQNPAIALSPDGTRLAIAYGAGRRGVVQVITLATGQARQWVTPPSWSPRVQSMGAWTANGRTLAVEELRTGGPPASPAAYRPPRATRVRLLDTAAPGTSLAAAPLLVLHAPARMGAPDQPYLTPGGGLLISPVISPSPDGTYLTRGTLTGELAVYSARTGTLLRTTGSWVWRFPSPPGRGGQPSPRLAWSGRLGGRLVVLQPSHDLNVLGVLAGGGFTADGGTLLPRQPAPHHQLEYALRHATLVAW